MRSAAPVMKMNNAANTQIIQVPRTGIVVPFRTDGGRETFEVDVAPLPPDHFQGDGNAVLSFATASGHVAALRYRAEGEVGSYLYSDQGKRIDVNVQGFPFLPYQLTGQLLIAKLRSHGKEGIVMRAAEDVGEMQVGVRAVTLEALCTLLRLPPGSEEALASDLLSKLGRYHNGTHMLGMKELQQLADAPILPAYARLMSEPTRSCFVFASEHAVTIYKTRDDKGRTLPAEDWTRSLVPRGKPLTAELKKEFPWLEELISETKQVPGIDTIRFTIDPAKGLQVFTVPEYKVLFQAPASHAIAEPLERGGLYFAMKNDPAVYRISSQELRLLVADESRKEITAERVALPRPGFVSGLGFDPRGNFLLVRASVGNGSEDLMILDQVNLRLSGMLQNVAPEKSLDHAMEVDGKGNLVYVDRDGHLRIATTSMGHLSHGSLRTVMERANKHHEAEQKELRSVEESIESLKVPEVSQIKVRRITQDDLRRQLEEKLDQMFTAKIAEVADVNELRKIRVQVDAVAQEPRYERLGAAFDAVGDLLERKQSQLELRGMTQKLDKLEGLLREGASWIELVEASKLLDQVFGERAKTLVRDAIERKDISERMGAAKDQIAALREARKGELETQIDETLKRYEKELSRCQTVLEVQQHAGNETSKLFELIAALGQDEAERRLIARVRNAADERRKEITAEIEALERRMREEQMDALKQLDALRETMKLELMGIASIAELGNARKHSALVREYMTWAGRLPEGLLKHELEKLDGVFARRQGELTVPGPATVLGEGGGWSHLLPIFDPPQVVWTAEIKPEPDQPGMGKLLFRDNFGRTFDPEHDLLPLDAASKIVLGAVEKYTSRAKEYFEGVTRDIPQFSEDWVINAWTEARLAEFGKLAKQQLRGDFGVLIVRSEAGVGKNMMWDIFACLTHRSLTTFSCNANTEVDDLTYLYQYDPKKRGTYKLNSNFIERLSIPGSIILLDEVNTLPPGVKKILNPLFDYRRTLFLPDGRRIAAHPSVIFVGLENNVTASYQGVHAHSSDLNSRARVVELDYPPFKDDASGQYLPYEAEMYAKQLAHFRGISSPDFAKLWDAAINSHGVSGMIAGLTSPERVSDLKMVHKIVNLAQQIRELHRQNTEGGEASFVFTPREGRQIMGEVRDGADLHDAVRRVLLPKVQELELRRKVGALIQAVIPSRSGSND